MKRPLKSILPFALFALFAVAAQLGLRAAGAEYCLTQLTMALYYAVVVMGLCLLMGYAGQVSLGHGAFFAIGGYTTAVLTTYDFSRFKTAAWAGWLQSAHLLAARENLFGNPILTATPWAAFFAAMLVTFLVACLIGYPALRLKGHYLAMATLGFGLIVNKLVLGSALTGATDGINGVPEWRLGFGLVVSGKSAVRVQNYYLACALVLALLVLLRNLIHSRVGRALLAIHDRETAANAMGINTAAYKLKAFVLSAMLAALAGVCFTHYTAGIGPSEAGAIKSVRYVALAAAGGFANLWGVTAMSTALNYLSLRGLFGSFDHAVFGGILIVIVALAPEGPLKPLGLWLRRLAGRLPRPLGGEGRGEGEGLGTGTPNVEPSTFNAQRSTLNAQRSTLTAHRPMALLTAQNIRRSFGGLVAVDRVSFKVDAGQIKAIIGPNGAGKTTLFNIISGLLTPNLGTISFKGQSITGCKPYQVARLGLSRTFQNPSLFLRMSVRENVMVGRHPRSRWEFAGCGLRLPGQPKEEQAIGESALAHLHDVGLAHLAERPASSLAFGQRRLVELARALATEPELLLLDEPASGLNPREKADLGQLIRTIRARGITILLVEHDMTLVMDLSDEILALHHGAPIAEGPPAMVQNDPQVISIYLGEPLDDVAASEKS